MQDNNGAELVTVSHLNFSNSRNFISFTEEDKRAAGVVEVQNCFERHKNIAGCSYSSYRPELGIVRS